LGNYEVTFCLGGETGEIKSGINTATPAGIKNLLIISMNRKRLNRPYATENIGANVRPGKKFIVAYR